jgi:hypothetical protein
MTGRTFHDVAIKCKDGDAIYQLSRPQTVYAKNDKSFYNRVPPSRQDAIDWAIKVRSIMI